MKVVEQGELPADILPILGGVSPLLLLKMHGKLDIEVDDYMKEQISSNPIAEPFMMDASTIVMSASKVHSDEDEDFEEYLKEKFDAIQRNFIKFACSHLGNEVDVSICHQRAGLKARLTADGGLNLLLKNALKF